MEEKIIEDAIDRLTEEIIAFTGNKAYTETALTWRKKSYRITKCHEDRIYLDRLTVSEAKKLYDFIKNRYGDTDIYDIDNIYDVEGHDDDESRQDYWRDGFGYGRMYVSRGLIDNSVFACTLNDFNNGEKHVIMNKYLFDSWLQFFEDGLYCGLDDPEDMDEEDIEFHSGVYKSAVEYFSAHENDFNASKVFVVSEDWSDDYDRFHFAVVPDESTYIELVGEKYRLFIDIDRLADLELEKNKPEEDEEEEDDDEY